MRHNDDLEDLIGAIFGQPYLAYRDYGAGGACRAPVRVFRVEMPNGNGPFNSGLPNAHEIYAHICGSPDALEHENGGQMGLSERSFAEAHEEADYGCDSMGSVALWFHRRAREYLRGLGATVVEYEVPRGGHLVRCGHGEVLFAKHECRRVAEHDLVDDVAEPTLAQLEAREA